VDGRDKLIRCSLDDGRLEWEYFDLARDPGETSPFDLKAGGDRALELKRSIEDFIRLRRLDQFNVTTDQLPPEEVIEQMHALGYF